MNINILAGNFNWLLFILIIVFVILLFFVSIGFVFYFKYIVTDDPKKYLNTPAKDPTGVSLKEAQELEENRLIDMKMEEITIRSFDGLNLHGYYKEASNKTTKTIISVHSFHGSALHSAPLFSSWLTDYNYNILFIDLRSYGKSEGKYTTYGTYDSRDVSSWIDYLIERGKSEVDICLFGLSLGAHTVMTLSDKVKKEVKCIIEDSGYTNTFDEFSYRLKNDHDIPNFILYPGVIITRLLAHFNLRELDARESLKSSKVPVLFIHREKDDVVPVSMAEEAYNACTSEKEIKIFKGEGHARNLFLNKEDYYDLVLDFLVKNL